jgi:hypothetical protein
VVPERTGAAAAAAARVFWPQAGREEVLSPSLESSEPVAFLRITGCGEVMAVRRLAGRAETEPSTVLGSGDRMRVPNFASFSLDRPAKDDGA